VESVRDADGPGFVEKKLCEAAQLLLTASEVVECAVPAISAALTVQ
jgi:hypothetical protein